MIAKMRVGQNANAETMYQDKGCYDGGISHIRCEQEEQRVMASATSVMKLWRFRCANRFGACFPREMSRYVFVFLG
jgi:hypothetical protein